MLPPLYEYAQTEVLTLTNKNLDSIFEDVSIYVAIDYREWFAECFAEALDSQAPREMANALLDLLDSAI